MRRQARISGGGALVVRSASALQVWLWLLIFIFQNEFRISRSIQPGYLDFDNLPETNFTCAGKVIGGYYADLETSCQMFHVCTVGQQDEPMDIKFLCLNGTVFDQETRVCERVDEVDCTKSESFYSLNLELYGSTLAPPVMQTDQIKPQVQTTEQPVQKTKPLHEHKTDPFIDESTTTLHNKEQEHSTDIVDSTEDPIEDIKKEDHKHTQNYRPIHQSLPEHSDVNEDYQAEESDEDNDDYEEDYSHTLSTTIAQMPTAAPTTTTKRQPSTKDPLTTTHYLSSAPHLISTPLPTVSLISTPNSPSIAPSLPPIDPSLLSPQEFIYRHRGPGSEAVSFQSFRPADGVYITHAPPQQFDHFQYESSRTAPRPTLARPAPFVQRPQPAPFHPTTMDPRDQLLRPGPTSQSSERHEMSIRHRPYPYPSPLPVQRPLPFNPYYYDRKRSDDSSAENESSLSARSVSPLAVTDRPPAKIKSPPRVIVTASASVSDSNGKRLNYTVGNVVSAVKPIVAINYDNYKESDLIFDPFFLDVPKLQKLRKARSNKKRRVITASATATVSSIIGPINLSPTTSAPVTSRATTTERTSAFTTLPTTTTTSAWNPNDYVDDNYEPHSYVPPLPPLAIVVAYEHKKQEKLSNNHLFQDLTQHKFMSTLGQIEQSRPTSSAVQTTSSQIEGAGAAPLPSPRSSHAAGEYSCSADCQTRA